MTTTTTLDTRAAEAQILAERERWWLAWRAYIAEQRTQLQRLRTPQDAGGDDLTIGLAEAGIRSAIPGGLRQELDAILEERRQDALLAQPRADADELLAGLLDQIDAELHGRVHPDGLALVRVGDSLVTFDHRAVAEQTAPEDLAALIGTSRQKRRRPWLAVAVGVVGLVVVVLVAQYLAGPTRRTATTTAPVVLVGSNSVAVWDVRALRVGTFLAERPRAMLDGAGLTVCASAPQRQALQAGATVTISSTGSLRAYQITALSPDAAIAATADLLLADCTGNTPRPLAAAAVQEARSAAPLDPAQLVAVHTWSSDVWPERIPPDQMEVALTLTTGARTDGQLILPDGSSRAPAQAPETTSAGTVVRVLVPRVEAAQRMAWQIPDGAGLPRRLPLDVPAPIGHAALLQTALRVSDARLVPGEGDVLTLHLTLQLTPDAPALQLNADDLSVADSRGRAVPISWTPPTLTPGTATPVVIQLSPDQAAPLIIQLGAWRAQVGGSVPPTPLPKVP